VNCSSLDTCRECNETNNYFLNTDLLCYPCTLTNCITCTNLTACVICDSLDGYTINMSTLLCELCNIPDCINCTDTTTCQSCDYNNSYYLLPNSTCGFCDPGNNTFINSTTLDCEDCTLSNCLVCSSLTTC
jgi:hypothetical protein